MKHLSFILCLFSLVLVLGLVGCTSPSDENKLSIVATNFAAYDFAREIVGNSNTVSVTFMTSGDVHSFNPTFKDMATIKSADLFLYVGGTSDAALDTLLKGAGEVNTLRLIDCVTLLHESDHEHEHETEHEHGDAAYDEHVWTSPKNAILIVQAMLDAIVAIDEANGDTYRQNAAAYTEQLSALSEKFETLIRSQTKTAIFGDRFPLLYFANAYGLRYEAAFPGCHATAEPSPARIAELIALAEQEEIAYIFHIEGATQAVASRIAEETGASLLLFHTCHKVTSEELKEGASYLTLMENNYQALEKALR